MPISIGLTVSEMSTATFYNAVQRGLARISSNTPLERDRCAMARKCVASVWLFEAGRLSVSAPLERNTEPMWLCGGEPENFLRRVDDDDVPLPG
jgi:hypothetical protein